MGAYYLQAKAPMLAVEALAPRPGERVLDLCAAPGGKTSQIAVHMRNSGLIVANDMSKKRVPALVGNLERCGVGNAVITQAPGTMLARYFPNYFDRVLLDAPCSGDGIVRKDRNMLRYWSPEDAQRQAQTQIGLLRAAFHMLRPGGTLVYSTCSLSIEENEHVLLALLKREPDVAEILPLPALDSPPLAKEFAQALPPSLLHGQRVWPHIHDTEGAFVARITKHSPTCWPQQIADANTWTTSGDEPSVVEAIELIEKLWQFTVPRVDNQVLTGSGRHLLMQPAESEGIKEQLPFFVRGGMRIGRHHKQHYFLTQQAISLWGHLMRERCLDLCWEQVVALFRGQPLQLPEKTSLRGEVLCRFGPWSVTRGIIGAEGSQLKGMLPRSSHRDELICFQ
jgi:NOL1/NOP2/sun family putative RNA methylase